MELTDPMLKYVWDKIELMQPGEILIIKTQAPNNPHLWVECAKRWMDIYHCGGFDKNMNKFKKTPTFQEINEQFNN